MQLLNIGFGSSVSTNKLVAIVSPESKPIKQLIEHARSVNNLVDATYGRRTRAVVITETHVILAALQPETISDRLDDETSE